MTDQIMFILLVQYVTTCAPKSLNNKLIPNCEILPRDATKSAFMRFHVVCLSVRNV